MLVWLVVAAALPLGAASPAPARTSTAQELAGGQALNSFSIPRSEQFQARSPLQDGMIAREELGPDAHVGIGLAPMLGRNIHSVRIEQEPIHTSNPGVTFVIKFPH